MKLPRFLKLPIQFLSKLLQFPFVNVVKSLFCSGLNIIIYLIIAAVMVGLTQGGVIPLDLYIYTNAVDLVVNISFFHFLLYFLGLIMSLYPVYIYNFLFDDDNDNKFYSSTNWGLIYYGSQKEEDKNEPIDPESDSYSLKFIQGAVRKLLGILLFVVWSWIIVDVYCKHQLDNQHENIVILINTVFTCLIFYAYWFFTIKIKKRMDCDTSDEGKAKIANYKRIAKNYYKWYLPFLLLVHGLLCFLVYLFGWHFVTVIAQLGVCLLLSMHLLIYRTFRKSFEPISDIVIYLALHRRLGALVLLFLLALNIYTGIAEMINPINIIICNLIVFYTVIIMGFKIYFFLKYENKKKTKNYVPMLAFKFRLVHFIVAVLGFLLFLTFNYGKNYSLHQLKLVDSPKEENKIKLSQFYKRYQQVWNPGKAPILYAAYGGGLKAHYWNFMILDHLYKRDSFNNVLAMSGVSGGGMGIGNFAATRYLDFSYEQRQNVIKQVKNSNILSIELPWLFGWDFVRSSLPDSWGDAGSDRSHRSMVFYTDILDAPQMVDQTSFYEVYKKLFQDSYYPNLIINSTATTDKYGVVSAVNGNNMFPGAINLLDIKLGKDQKTLTYFEALSTYNRFPIISPPANVPNKGQFVDGGYFENSGIMSLISFKKALAKYEKKWEPDSIFSNKIKLISVRNGKFNYLQSILEEGDIDINDIQNNKVIKFCDENGIKTIIGGIGNLDRMPTYIKSMLSEYYQEEYEFINIDLPYYIDTSKIEKLFNAELDSIALRKVKELVKESNNNIINILDTTEFNIGTEKVNYKLEDWGVVNPPTARILSYPVELYMEAMMEHPYVKLQLERTF